MLALILGACGQAAAPPASLAPQSTPSVTPDPHVAGPVSADQIFTALTSGHLKVYSNNATGGPAPIVKRINADLEGWPLRITAYTTTASSSQSRPWKPGTGPGRGDAPYTLAALNVVIEYGPKAAGVAPPAADPAHQAIAASIVAILDPLLWPIEQHSVTTIPARTATAGGASTAPTRAPTTASPKPSAAP